MLFTLTESEQTSPLRRRLAERPRERYVVPLIMAGAMAASAAGGLAQAFGKSEVKGDLQGPTASLLGMLGFGAQPSMFSTPFSNLGSLDGPNYYDLLKGVSGRELPIIQSLMGMGKRGIGGAGLNIQDLLTQAIGGKNQLIGQAQGTRQRSLGALKGGYQGAKDAATRYLERQIQEIFRMEDAGAAATGVKSASTGSRASSRARKASEPVADLLAQIGMREAEQTAGVEERTGGNILQALGMGLQGESQAQQGYLQNFLNLMSQQRATELLPIQEMLKLISGFPSGQPYVEQNQAAAIGGGLQQIGSSLGGYGGYLQGQQNQDQMMKMLQQVVGSR